MSPRVLFSVISCHWASGFPFPNGMGRTDVAYMIEILRVVQFNSISERFCSHQLGENFQLPLGGKKVNATLSPAAQERNNL